ncbi:MAG: cyclic 2,3-diphosphoglycerate synthetase, partial [Planctomycetota bacterium]
YVNPREMTLDADALLEVAGRGGHAASDYWEEAALSKVPTIGCRRCGGGMAGTPVTSNVVQGARMAEDGAHRPVIMEGSGATFAPVRTDGRIVVVGAGQPPENVLEYLGRYRLLTSDLAIVTMCEKPTASPARVRELEEGILDIKPDIDVALTVFRPQPLTPVEGRDVFLATCAPRRAAERMGRILEDEHGCRVTGYTLHLSDRAALRDDLSNGLAHCDVLLTEVKAASIDVAARAANEEGVEVAFLHNQPFLVGGTVEDLDEAILSVCRKAEGSAG